MTVLRPRDHTVRGSTMIEVWNDGLFIAAVYPTERGVKIVSKHIENRPGLLVVDPGEDQPLRSFDGRAPVTVSVNILP